MNHQVEALLKVSLENIKEMIDVDTIVGNPIITPEATIIPISKVKMGFLAGGSEIAQKQEKNENPFGGGTGGTVSITPVAFLVVIGKEIKVLHLEQETHLYEKVIDKIPGLVDQVKKLFKDEADIYQV